MPEFDVDPSPGQPKILFIGWPESSHTHSWIDLLEGSAFNYRLFCLPAAEPPAEWPVRCYLTASGLPIRSEPMRRTVFPPPPRSIHRAIQLVRGAAGYDNQTGGDGTRDPVSRLARVLDRVYRSKHAISLEQALAKVIREWRPDIVHTLGFDPASYFYLRTMKRHGPLSAGRWVAQARGGPDIALQRYAPDTLPLIKEVFSRCDHFIADNQQNYDFAQTAGLAERKIRNPGMGVVSGPGGLDLEGLRTRWTLLPSRRDRIVVWPKAYEINSAKAMPVFEAIMTVWNQIQPCRIEMLWMTQPEVRIWYEKLFPEHIKRDCPAHSRLSREQTLDYLAKARVMLAPSLSDGIPNAMMEAMALGAAPIVSPLDTIADVVRNEENVLFARNLYPDEIAKALVRMMSDDELVDRIATNNLNHIRKLADRKVVRERAVFFYEEVAHQARKEHFSR
jgi:glycosyltransferase involved in cell wall biosynthesis